ncbi:hypothetical protein SAMN05192552_101463 [Natrinema hispanicum]|uniref:Uncharacterized protein n=1 Tax=Natrinema hispanicum TaxID=392421 RepID=A0A1G6SMS7_9EURY|nr:hypothetical protein SAMN05192552_101463 [Natrinema hispanicum]
MGFMHYRQHKATNSETFWVKFVEIESINIVDTVQLESLPVLKDQKHVRCMTSATG